MAGKCAKYGDDYVMGSELDTTDSEHSGSDNEEFVPPKKEATTRRGVERQPTRRPDPNVSNRNALLARENRRRKKEHLQELETQVEKFQADNSSMRKTIKQQAKMIKKLQKEKTYYKNLLQSQPQIVNVLERFNNNFKGNIYSSGAAKSLSPSSTGSSSPFSVDFNDNDINSVDYKSHDPTDYDLFGVNSPFHTAATPEYFSSTDCLSSISEEHNYTLDTPPTSSGICLHIAGDKVSVEFCSVCCENAKTVEGII
ncbi:hypothetical protein ACFFRR_008427 [Megaselia abdita]